MWRDEGKDCSTGVKDEIFLCWLVGDPKVLPAQKPVKTKSEIHFWIFNPQWNGKHIELKTEPNQRKIHR